MRNLDYELKNAEGSWQIANRRRQKAEGRGQFAKIENCRLRFEISDLKFIRWEIKGGVDFMTPPFYIQVNPVRKEEVFNPTISKMSIIYFYHPCHKW